MQRTHNADIVTSLVKRTKPILQRITEKIPQQATFRMNGLETDKIRTAKITLGISKLTPNLTRLNIIKIVRNSNSVNMHVILTIVFFLQFNSSNTTKPTKTTPKLRDTREKKT